MCFKMFFCYKIKTFQSSWEKLIYIVPGFSVDFDLVLYIKVYSRFETDRRDYQEIVSIDTLYIEMVLWYITPTRREINEILKYLNRYLKNQVDHLTHLVSDTFIIINSMVLYFRRESIKMSYLYFSTDGKSLSIVYFLKWYRHWNNCPIEIYFNN